MLGRGIGSTHRMTRVTSTISTNTSKLEPIGANSDARITHEVQRYIHGEVPRVGVVYVGPLEPTWARPDKVISCINGLSPSNVTTLLGAFGSANVVGPARIHQVRNACAHKSR